MFGGGRGGDEDEPDYYEEIGNMLLEGGYFRAQITTLAPFDKMVGGCARCKRSWAVATNTCASVVLLHVLCCCMCCCMCCVGATGAGASRMLGILVAAPASCVPRCAMASVDLCQTRAGLGADRGSK